MKETLAVLLGFLILALSGKLFYELYRRLCARFLPGKGEENGPAALLLTLFSLATVFLLTVMAYTVFLLELPLTLGSLILAGVLLLIFDHVLIFAGLRYSRRLGQRARALQLMRQKQQVEASYYRTLEGQYDRQRVLIHDIRRHLAAIRGLAEGQGDEAVLRYVEELEGSPGLQNRVRICGNPTLDVVLSHYSEICREKGIGFTADVRSQSADGMEYSDITALFGNLLENAVEAAEGSPCPEVELLVDSRPGGTLLLTLINSCAVPPIGDGAGGFVTRKPCREEHGLGLKSVQSVVKKHGGTMRQYYDEQNRLFHTVILLGQRPG